ncbi:DnaJ domain-containing protein [Candidatus Woesearchaeota archaeon]|nr:DnaJ domain-containing protein [Candidatus Woesearchaeota archaeon]
MKLKEFGLEERAKKILGLAEKANIDPKKIKIQFREKAKEYHPDVNKDEKASSYFKLIKQARNYLENKEASDLIENNELVEDFLGEKPEELGKSYNEWRLSHFYNIKEKSIWPDNDNKRKL